MANGTKRHGSRGFTLTELLVTVAIVIVLLLVAMVPISRMQRNIRQTELDSKAEMLFMAAQNRLTQLQAAGRQGAYQAGAEDIDELPQDADPDQYRDEEINLCYVKSEDKATDGMAAANIMPEDKTDAELWNAHWVIEYDKVSGSVYAVFYSEKASGLADYTPDGEFSNLRYRNNRLNAGAKIGYYGGDSIGANETGDLNTVVQIVNEEQLLVKIECDIPNGETPSFCVTLKDEDGHETEEIQLTKVQGQVKQTGDHYEAVLILDSLNDGERFCQQDWATRAHLVPGENLSVTVRVSVDNDLIDDAVVVKKTNSLFASVADNADGHRTAYIEYARHLQNLDEYSGVEELGKLDDGGEKIITAAVQRRDIEFAGEGDSWSSLYEDLTFRPIHNEYLTSYLSSVRSGNTEFHPVIYDLPVEEQGDAGLFATFNGGTLSYIRLAGAQIAGTANVGSLIGTVEYGKVTIEGCQVFLSEARGQLDGKDEQELWLTGKTTGGLVGAARSGSVNITDSFAATVLEGTEVAGGLVGQSRANLTIERSYADCYVYSDKEKGKAGGLLGTRTGTSGIEIQNAYAAGFLAAKETAGLIAGELSGIQYTLTNVYSACAPLEGGSLTYGTAKQTGEDGPTISNVYYLSETENEAETIGTHKSFEEWSGSNLAAAAKTLGSAFTAKTSDTNAYNLMDGMGLTNYSYPKLDGIPHYGDWQAEFESDALVYYEAYSDGTYGIYGANVSTLSNEKAVTGDGYGVICKATETGEVTVVDVADGAKAYTLSAGDAVTVTIRDKNGTDTEYMLLKLPKELVQELQEPETFYRELKVNGRSFFYDPHFASTVVTEMADAPQSISVRTARQLNCLSRYYDAYKEGILPAEAVFRQGRSIDYGQYDWETYGQGGETVESQAPIGKSDQSPFTHTYDGGSYPITGVSFASESDGVYAGMFGRSDGTLRSVVLTTDKALEDAAVPTVSISGIVQHKTVYIGTLVGVNYGTVTNCSVSGYVHEGRTYNGYAYVGTLAGYNSGVIRSSSAVGPLIDEEGTFAYLYVGGFTGGNSGQIRQSYVMANIEIMSIRAGKTTLAGFAPENYGTIRDSYCATALSSAGGDTYGFAPNTGSVSNCYYLNGGTYSFAGDVHLYDYEAGTSGAAELTDEELAALALSGFDTVDAAHTAYYPNTAIKETEEAVYPYPGSFTGTDGQPTHYGDWVTKADMGTVGIVYWEQEEGGSNSGYHFSFIGFESGIDKRGSSLCTAHDDGGAVTHYGYGYYYKTDEVKAEMTASMTGRNDSFVLGAENETVKAELEKQVPGFTFTVYETADDGLHLESSDAANGYWTLTQTKQGEAPLSYRFELCPFFANAYTVVEKPGAGADPTAAELGKEALPYEIRSLAQLQYINWSYARSAGTSGGLKGSTTTYVTSQTYRYFPYLQYTTNTGKAKQTRAAAEANRPARAWQQTHDLSGTEEENFQPIAGALYDDTDGNSYDMVLYAWFGSKYDGQSYYIKNINIDSYGYNVGVFGTTAGANIWNVVLYSDEDSVIQRRTESTKKGTDRQEDQYVTAYALGGLIGIAYDYDASTGATIKNCAIAGYQIQDNSKNKLALGEAAVGGLIGVSCANLQKCSAVVDIKVNCTHRWAGTTGGLNSAKWGNFIRVGGLVGGLRDKATDCYTGGSIEISKETLKEQVEAGDENDTKFCTGSEGVAVKSAEDGSEPATYVYVGGIGASGFSANFRNFTGQSNTSTDGQPKFYNCYTYITLPAMEGTISGIAIIGSAADRFNWTTATVENCYYLESTKKSISFANASRNRCKNRTSLYDYFNNGRTDESDQSAMLNGDMTYVKTCFWGDPRKMTTAVSIDGLTSLSYAEMASRDGGVTIKKENTSWWFGEPKPYDNFKDALGSGFDWVTINEDGASIHGKYSFPGSDAALAGQDYPFPTVLTQDSDFGKVHLHYGAWPKVGLYWSQGVAELDLIANYDAESKASILPLELRLENVTDVSATAEPVFTYGTDGIVKATAERKDSGSFAVSLEGLQVGATEVTAVLGGYTARMTVTVTADLIVTAEPSIIEKYTGDTTDVTFTATDRNGREVSDVKWSITNSNSDAATFTEPVETTVGGTADARIVMQTTVTNRNAGETSMQITALWKTKAGAEYSGSTVLTVTTYESNILGVASGGSFCEGTLDQELAGWAEGKTPASKAYTEAEAPSCGSSTLFLYSRGTGADLNNFTVTSIMAGTADALIGEGSYTALLGEIETVGTDTCRPITLYGIRKNVQLTIELTDQRNGAKYQFTVSAAAQTTVSAEFKDLNGNLIGALTKSVAYGTMPTIDATADLNMTAPEGSMFKDLRDVETGWKAEPAITGGGLRRPTVFTPILVEKPGTEQ